MNNLTFLMILVVLLTGSLTQYGFAEEAQKPAQTLYPTDSQKSFKSPKEYFTGDVQVQMLFPPNKTAHYSGAYVTFQPGARTNWHFHPAGQHMIVTSGVVLTGTRNGKVIEFEEGETVWCPSNIDHWHGATPDHSATHLVITGVLDDKAVIWKEKVSDEQYYGSLDKKNMNAMKVHALTKKQQAMVPIAAFTAGGDLEKLKKALNEGLNAGLTVNEIKEIQIQLYAYAGFPRSLNGLSLFMQVLEDRKAKGITDKTGRDSSPLPTDKSSLELGEKIQTELVGRPVSGPLFDFAPTINVFLKSHLFGDIFGRDILNHKDREIVTVAALAGMKGVAPQLIAHVGISKNSGVTDEQLDEIMTVLKYKVGSKESLRLKDALEKIRKASADKK